MTDLSGRVDNLEQQIVAFPTSEDFESLSTLSSARFNTLNGQLSDIQSKLATLTTYMTNLKLYTTDLQRAFTGHTGQYLSGSNPAHHGI